MVRLLREPVVVHDFAADERLERQGGEHIKAKAEAGDLYYEVSLGREVVKNVALCERPEGEEAGERHGEAGDERDEGAVVGDGGKAVDGWCTEGAVNEEGVVVTDEGYIFERRWLLVARLQWMGGMILQKKTYRMILHLRLGRSRC